MRKHVLRTIPLLVFFSFCISNLSYGHNPKNTSVTEAKNIFTPDQWKADIDYLVRRLEIVHPGMYSNTSKEHFSILLNQLYKKASYESDVNMYFGIMELVNSIRDGHTWISWGDGKIGRLLHVSPLSVYMFSDGLFIISAINKYAALVGKKIVKVGNVSTEEFMKRRSRTKSGENKWNEIMAIDLFIEELHYLNVLDTTDQFKLTVEAGTTLSTEVEIDPVPLKEFFPSLNKLIFPRKDSLTTTMNGNSTNPWPLWLPWLDSQRNINDRYWYKYLPEQEALYVKINDCHDKENDPFDKFYRRMFETLDEKNAKRLIIDIRNNMGGNQLEQPLLLGIIERPNINKTDGLFLITNRFVFSSAQHLVTQLTRYTHVTTFGEPTGSKPNFYGGQRGFELPNSKIYIAHSTKLWQDAGPNDFRTSTEPDFYIPLTSTDFRENHDPVLDRIFTYDSYKNMKLEFSDKLIRAYEEGAIERVIKSYAEIKPTYAKYGFNLEKLIYADFGSWLSENAKNDKEYIVFLRFLAQEFPRSIDVWWDLASSLNNPESIEERITCYKKCLEINPAHNLAKMNLNLIEFEKATQLKTKQ